MKSTLSKFTKAFKLNLASRISRRCRSDESHSVFMSNRTPIPGWNPPTVGRTALTDFTSSSPQGEHESITSLSPEVFDSMVRDAIDKKDFETLNLIIREGTSFGRLSKDVLESAILECVKAKNWEYATILLTSVEEKSLNVSEEICQLILSRQTSSCKWIEAAQCITYMIRRDYAFPTRDILFVLGGLLASPNGAQRSLGIMSLVADHRRDDVVEYFNLGEVG